MGRGREAERSHDARCWGSQRCGSPVARALSLLVPLVEGTVALVLVAVPRAGAVGALVALACFTGVLVSRLQDGPPVRCGCFGSRSDEDISFVEPLRNGLLALLAMAAMIPTSPVMPALEDVVAVSVAVIDRPRRPRRRPARARRAYQPSGPDPRHAMSGAGWIASYVALWVAVLVLAVACLVLLRRAREVEALLRGDSPSDAARPRVTGGPRVAPLADLFDYGATDLTLLAFTKADCEICAAIEPHLGTVGDRVPGVRVEVIRARAEHHVDLRGLRGARTRPTPSPWTADGLIRAAGSVASIDDVDAVARRALAARPVERPAT